jgi:hypothetical protein
MQKNAECSTAAVLYYCCLLRSMNGTWGSVVAVEINHSLAYRTATVALPLAHLGVLLHPLYHLADVNLAVGVFALTSVLQQLK